MKATVIVEKSPDGSYSAYLDEDMPDFGIAGYGNSAKEAIDDFHAAIEDTAAFLSSKGKEMPQMNFTFLYDLQSFFSYFSYLNISKVGEKSGISPSLMRQYASGAAKAGPRQYERIRRTIGEMVSELSTASI